MTWRLAKSLETLRSQINALAPNRDKSSDGSIGDASHAAGTSDHNPNAAGVVTAIDITNDPAHGINSEELAEQLRAARDPRLKYIISNKKICSSEVSPWLWRPYTGANPHNHHVHVSVKGDHASYDLAIPWAGLSAGAQALSTGPAHVYPVLRRGASGSEVAALQTALNKRGAKLRVDGNFGPATEQAVLVFQRAHDLVPDGIVGRYTGEALA